LVKQTVVGVDMSYLKDYKFEYCKFNVDGPIATFMWSDPPVRNAYNLRSWEGFHQAVERVRDEDDIRVLIITGDPEGKNFCGGLNVKSWFGAQLSTQKKDEELEAKEGVVKGSGARRELELTPGTPDYERRLNPSFGGAPWDARRIMWDPKVFGGNFPEDWTPGRMRYEQWRRKGYTTQHAFKLLELDKPVIAMVNGPAFGAGCDIIFHCDIIIASEENAKLEWTYIRRGMVAPDGATYFLPRICGRHIALELLWRGKAISARQAYEWGLINHVVPHAELEKYTHNLAMELATESPPMIMGAIKDVVHKGYDDFIHNYIFHYQYLMGVATGIYQGSEDELEGSRAFVEKRKPVYKFR